MQKRKSGCYCITLRRAAQAISDLYDAHMAAIGITVNQYSLLSKLGHYPNCSVSELAEYARLERTTVVRALKPLTAKGLIKDLSDEGERKRNLCLTTEGEEIVKKGKVIWHQEQEEIERRLGKDGVEQLQELLEKLMEKDS
nr:MarR family winged helix-turn-helix transcriptional regulator [uncultured Anaerostipes sp.]